MTFAAACGHIEVNPARDTRRNRRPALTRFLSREELARLHAALDAQTRQGARQQADIVRLLLFTGCRKGEIMGLRWSEVREDGLALADSKTGPRTVVRGMVDRLRELEARQDTLNERLSAAPADLPDIHPNIADIYRRKVARLAEALNHPEDRDAAASAIWGLIARIVLTPSEKWAEMDAVLHGDLGSMLEWAGNGGEKAKTDIPMPEMSVSVVAGARNVFCYNLGPASGFAPGNDVEDVHHLAA